MAHTHFEHHGTDHNKPHAHAGHEHHAYGWALLLTLCFAVVEAITGWWSGSLALLSDAGHMFTDSLSLLLAGAAAWLAQKPPSERHSYGLARLEILAALVNSLFMLAIVAGIAYEAIDRYQHPRPVNGSAVMLVALIGLLINLGVGWLLTRGEDSLNRRAALVHVIGDALGSIAALTAGLVISLTGWLPIDPILSIVVALLILVSTLNLLRETIHVLMEGVPSNISLNEVGKRLAGLEGVMRVHDLHIWTLASGQVAISAHLNLRELSAWPRILNEAREVLNHDFGIGHVTLQPEVVERTPVAFHPHHE